MKVLSSKSSRGLVLDDESLYSRRFTADVSLEEAASLLQQVAHLASAEVSHDLDYETIEKSTRRSLFSNSVSSLETSPEQDSPQLCPTRMRTVSISSQSVDASSPLCTSKLLGAVPAPLSPPPLTLFSPSRTVTSVGPLHHPLLHAISPPQTASKRPLRLPTISNLGPTLRHVQHAVSSSELDAPSSRKQKYVGTTTPHKVRGILRHKFSWKKYPELEDFLIEKRDEYLRHSSQHNYTSTQKAYNNTLTNLLLERAAALGYIFEHFTYVQVRDRIRCYYKSYMQSLKKRT